MKNFVLFLLFISTVMLFGCGQDTGDRPIMPDVETLTVEPPKGMVVIPTNVGAFYMDQFEVTNAEYKDFVEDQPQWGKNRIPANFHDGKYLKHWPYPTEKKDHPVVYVSWRAANAYAKWAGKRLPTGAEWEYAARGGQVDKKYPWGDSIDDTQANYGLNVGDTVPVGQYAPNGYDLYDMIGNVWEWCSDPYESVDNFRVLRGGSWFDTATFVRVSTRNWSTRSFTSAYIGFRCAKSP